MSNLTTESNEFAGYLENWLKQLPVAKISDIVKQSHKAAVISVDIINGFCYTGALSSPRVADIVTPICNLFTALHTVGLKHFILTQDTHEPDAVEFADFPPHCIRGTSESETVDAFKALPFFSEFVIFPKNSINSALNSGLAAWIEAHPEVDTFIVVGDCTDLCVYQLAMFLRLDANARQLHRRVVVPEACVQTYDTPVATALENHLAPHPGDWMHAQFLNHMSLNGIEIVKNLE
jgi:nicotinamidase-related amidase